MYISLSGTVAVHVTFNWSPAVGIDENETASETSDVSNSNSKIKSNYSIQAKIIFYKPLTLTIKSSFPIFPVINVDTEGVTVTEHVNNA